MTPEQAVTLIDAAGGNRKFAELLGIHIEPGHKQRVSNWRKRGIPPAVVLAHRLVIDNLQTAISNGQRRSA